MNFDDLALTDEQRGLVAKMLGNNPWISGRMLFGSINMQIPLTKSFFDIDFKSFYEEFISAFQIPSYCISTSSTYSSTEKGYKTSDCLIRMRRDLLVSFEDDDFGQSKLVVYYSYASNTTELDKLFEFILRFKKEDVKSNHIGLLYETPKVGLEINYFETKAPEVDLITHYNDDLIPAHQDIISRLNKEKDKGIILLHGAPGTGKTTYIRHLTSLVKKNLIYFPPDMAARISSPELIPFLMKHTNSVLIIEDAESIIEDRATGSKSAVSNLLNLSDGLLSDCLNIQVLCTFNSDLARVDKALLRKGRLIAKYHFKPLSPDKAQKLSDSLGFKTNISEPITLAELYNQNQREYDDKQGGPIGFTAG